MNIISVSKSVIFTLLSFCVTSAQGDQLNIPNKFEKGGVLIADDMNKNFNAIATAVNDLDDSLEARSQFVGFSTSTVTGTEGIFAMQQACNDFSSDSHVCNSTEVAQSTYNLNTPLPKNSEAWILVDIRSALSQFNLKRENSPKTLSCDGWNTTEGAMGATVTAKGMFKTADCNVATYVACCELKSP